MPKTYTTTSGDMWDLIALKTLGDENHKDILMKSNAKHRYIYIFPAGLVLTIPDITEEPSDTLPPWKQNRHD
ncbi:MAG: phage tail protein [Oscillospiraceae bacterium]|nr:phage tail protein [Oscillospiraceae bacterium]